MIGGFFRRNLGLKALSLTLALLTWAYLTYGADAGMRTGVTQQVEVPIVLQGVTVGTIAEPAQRTVSVVVSAGRGPFDAPSAREFAAVVDLHGVHPGTHSLVPHIVGPKDVEVERVRPASVVVIVSRLLTRRVPVSVLYSGKPAQVPGAVGANVAPATVTVRGAASAVSRIVMAAAEVPADRVTEGFDALLAPVALDVRGRPVADVLIAPNLVHVSVAKPVTSNQ